MAFRSKPDQAPAQRLDLCCRTHVYAGIGSRRTPTTVLQQMEIIGFEMAEGLGTTFWGRGRRRLGVRTWV